MTREKKYQKRFLDFRCTLSNRVDGPPSTVTLQNYQKQKFLFVTTREFKHEETQHFIDDVFENSWNYGIMDVNALVYNSNSSWSLITFLPYDNEDCTKLTYKTLATFTAANYSQLADIPLGRLYDRKMRNMRKCPVKVVIYTCEPYVFETQDNGKMYDGIEIRIIETIASLLNFTPQYVLPQDKDGNLWPNNSKTYCLQMVSRVIPVFRSCQRQKAMANIVSSLFFFHSTANRGQSKHVDLQLFRYVESQC